MFNLQFKDDAGEDLYVDGMIEVSFPDQAAGNFTLWKLNTESGVWEPLTPYVLADRRKRRQAVYRIGGIDMSRIPPRSFINVDAVFKIRLPERRCYFKARVYKDQSLSEQLINDNAAYSVKFRRTKGKAFVSYYGPTLSLWKLMGFCLGLPCGNSIGYISLNSHYVYEGAIDQTIKAAPPKSTNNILTYELIDDSTTIGVSLVMSYSGPFFSSAYTCTASDITQNHLRFYKASTPNIYTAQLYSPGGPPVGENRKLMDKVWYPKRGRWHTICLTKMKVTFTKSHLSPETSLKFHVFSFGGHHTDVKGFLYGIREYYVDISETTQYTCAEYKCSGKLHQSSKEDFTRVKIALAARSSYSCQIQLYPQILSTTH